MRWGAWVPYLQFGGAYDNVFRILRRHYCIAVSKIPAEEGGEKPDRWIELLGTHLMVFYWRGLIGLGEDDLVCGFMRRASPRLRKQALEFIGRSLLNTVDTVLPEILERLKALWESRVRATRTEQDRGLELAGFGTWFLSAKFDNSWALDQLRQVMELTDGDAINAYPLIKRLAVIAPQVPGEAIQILDQLLFGRRQNWQFLSGMSEVGEILKAALGSGNAAVAQGVISIVNKLAERGDTTHRPLVSQLTPI